MRASLKSLYAFRQEKTAAIEFLASHFQVSANTAAKTYPNALEILTPDGEITEAKVRHILGMMQDVGNKETKTIQPAAVVDFSFLRQAQRELGRPGNAK